MSITAVGLTDALCQILRLNSTIATAFGDTWNPTAQTGIVKFFADWADQNNDPYLVFDEVSESYDFDTRSGALAGTSSFRAEGSLLCWIFQSGREQARALATLICNQLDNCDQKNTPVQWPQFNGTCTLLDFRMLKAQFAPNPNIGPGVPSTFVRVVTFNYTYQGYI